MQNFKIPGVIWTVLLLALGVLINANAEWIQKNLGINPLLVGAAVTAVFAAAKWVDPGTGPLNQAIDTIEQLLRNQSAVPVAGHEGVQPSAQMRSSRPAAPVIVPERPSRTARWLIG